jgi:hypothetical protein
MTNSRQPHQQALVWRRRVMAFAVLALLGGCGTTNGDFAEVRPTLVSDDIHDWVGPYASADEASKFALTDDERQLRDLAYPLIEAPYNRQKWYSIVGEYGIVRPNRETFDRTLYATRLVASRHHSPAGRYTQLSEDVRNDMTRMPQFFETASRVLDIDAKRQKSLSYVSALSPAELNNARQRMQENESIVALVRTNLTQRAASYRFALERLVVMTPSPLAVDIERAINQMLADIARYRNPAPTWVREQNLVTVR